MAETARLVSDLATLATDLGPGPLTRRPTNGQGLPEEPSASVRSTRRCHEWRRLSVRFPEAWAGAVLALALLAAPAGATEPAKHSLEFWRKIKASDFAVPAGEAPLPLILELSDSLGSTDPEIRDGFGYDIPVAWIYGKKLLTPADLRIVLARWSANLRTGIGETASDSVLLRSFRPSISPCSRRTTCRPRFSRRPSSMHS
jgi:hypothetical protein